MGSAALVFDHPAVCPACAIASMKPAWGHPALRAKPVSQCHNGRDGATDSAIPAACQLWFASTGRQAHM
jgi:hypothetical protein